MAWKSKTPEEQARMLERCQALARKYRDSDEGTPDSDELTDDAETTRRADTEPADEPETPPRASDRYPELYKGSLPEF